MALALISSHFKRGGGVGSDVVVVVVVVIGGVHVVGLLPRRRCSSPRPDKRLIQGRISPRPDKLPSTEPNPNRCPNLSPTLIRRRGELEASLASGRNTKHTSCDIAKARG